MNTFGASHLRRRNFLRLLASTPPLLAAARAASSQSPGPRLDPNTPLLLAPDNPEDWPTFRQTLLDWRAHTRRRLDYNDRHYRDPSCAWTQRAFCCGFLMLFDAMLYDPQQATLRVEALLDAAHHDFGGFDAVVLWHAYPRIGADPRNQYDFYRDQPGGILGLRQVVRRFHDRGVSVFLDYNPWDTGTRREPRSDAEVLSILVQALDADGVFLDTLDQGMRELSTSLQAGRPGTVLESELALPLDRIADHHLSWAQGFQDSPAPGVLRNKWFERRHQLHLVDRWAHDHTAELQSAWMNGTGILVWENVFGSWMGWSPRDRSVLRAMLPIQRRFAHLFTGEGWTPLVPTGTPDTYATLWEDDNVRLWTLVNRSEEPRQGPLLTIRPRQAARCFDLLAGHPVELQTVPPHQARWIGTLPARGIGCLLEAPHNMLGEDFERFLRAQALLARRHSHSTTAEPLLTRSSGIRATPRSRRLPEGMAAIPGGPLRLETTLRVRECGFYVSTPAAGHRLGSSYHPSLERFTHDIVLEPFAMDATPVTNAEFVRFLSESDYRPKHPQNFLKHWGHGHAPYGQEDHPVTWIDLEDARAYAGWAGKRLPTEHEWQVAAQGPEAYAYPWGADWRPNHANDGSQGPNTTAVRRFPQGRSPHGVWDLCGNVWEWTESARSDGHTRFCLLKGGSFYRAEGSDWYFEGGPQTNQHAAKFILSWPGLDRCATIGFRCVVDLSLPPRG